MQSAHDRGEQVAAEREARGLRPVAGSGTLVTESGKPDSTFLESPLTDKEQSEYARGGRLLKSEARLTQKEARLEAGLETVAVEPAETVLQVDTRALERLGVGPHLEPDESVRLDVFPELDLGAPEESANVRLHVGRSDVEDVGAERASSLASSLIGQNAECHAGELLCCQCGPGADQIVAASCPGRLEL